MFFIVLWYNIILCQTLFSEGVDNVGKDLKGKELGAISIKDVAVTIAKLLDVPAVKEWEGKALV